MTTRNILNDICPRLVKVDNGDPILGLEILDGPYKGVVFSFTKFSVLREREENGMVPTRFETTVHTAPDGFRADETFDLYCSEVLLAWLGYISMTNLQELARMETKGIH